MKLQPADRLREMGASRMNRRRTAPKDGGLSDLLVDDPEAYSRVSEAEYRAGDRAALMRMIVYSALSKLPIPEWAANILDGAYGQAAWGQIASWDEIFGKPPSRKIQRARKNWLQRYEIWHRIEVRSKRGPINDDLFDEIGRELGIGGKTEVKRLYRIAREEWREFVKVNKARLEAARGRPQRRK